MSALSRRKGRRFELDVSKALKPLYPGARPNLAQSRGTRRDGPDILGVPWWVECCHSAANKLAAKWAQACRDADAASDESFQSLPPVVVCKRNRQPAIVLMRAATLGTRHCPPSIRVMLTLDDWIAVLAWRGAMEAIAPQEPTLLAPRWGDVTEVT